jgi:hypothetical protein
LHSVVDYPLRTPTLSVLFAIACGFLIPLCRIERSAESPAAIERFARENVVRPRERYHDL